MQLGNESQNGLSTSDDNSSLAHRETYYAAVARLGTAVLPKSQEGYHLVVAHQDDIVSTDNDATSLYKSSLLTQFPSFIRGDLIAKHH